MTTSDTRKQNSEMRLRGRPEILGVVVSVPALQLLMQHFESVYASAYGLPPYFIWFAVSLATATSSLLSARHATLPAVRVAWSCLGGAALAWSISIVFEAAWRAGIEWYIFSVGPGRLLYLLYSALLAFGVFMLTSHGPRSRGLVHVANVGVIGCAMLLCTLLVLLEPVIRSEGSIGYALFAIADLSLLLTATIMALHYIWTSDRGSLSPVVLLLGLSASVHAAANIAYYYKVFLEGAYGTSHDVYWTIAILLHFWASYEQRVSHPETSLTALRMGWIARTASTAQVLLPAALILGTLALLFAFSDHLTPAFGISALLPATFFALFLGLREWALDRQRKRLVADLSESHSLNTHVLSASPGVIVIVKTSPGFPVSYISENGHLLFGIDRSTFDFEKHIHPSDRDVIRQGLKSTMTRGSSTSEFRLLDSKGEWHWIDQKLVLKPESEGRPAEVIGTLVDITERKKMQRSIAQTQRLESVGRLSGSIAHDFNNLLTTILGFSGLLLSSGKLSGDENQQVAEIQAAGERGASLTRQLLSYSRRHTFSVEVVDLTKLVAGMRGMLERLLGEGIRLEFRLSPLPVRVEASKSQLEQVVMNLVLNARDAMPDGGCVQIAVDETILESEPGDDDLCVGPVAVLTVRDEGTGMDDSVLEQLFEPFFTTKNEGTGLGLATVHGVVREHKGRIKVESSPRRGTCFEVFLPATLRQVAASDTDPRAPTLGGSERILVVDDEAAITGVVASILEPLGYEIFTANNADEAIEFARSQPFDLLLSDIVMPGCNGHDLARRLRKIRDGFQVIYMSGYTDDVLAQHHLAQDDTPLLQKPLVVSQLATEIRKEFDRETVHAKSGT
jgi:signal transduction histidine kinase/CheY-like chemotaxis protein